MYDFYENHKQFFLNLGLILFFGSLLFMPFGGLSIVFAIIGGIIGGSGLLIFLVIGLTEHTVSLIFGFAVVLLVALGIAGLCIPLAFPEGNEAIRSAVQISGLIVLILGLLVWGGRTAYLMFTYGFSYREPYKKAKYPYLTKRDARKRYDDDYDE